MASFVIIFALIGKSIGLTWSIAILSFLFIKKINLELKKRNYLIIYRYGNAIGDHICMTGVISKIYKPLYLIETPILFTDLKTAELIKYAGNAFLAVKISYINPLIKRGFLRK